MITVNEKKEFLRWFLFSSNLYLKSRESSWLLHYILSDDRIIKNTHFVDQASFCPRGIVMSTHCVDDVPFQYYKNNTVTTDAEKCFQDIRLNKGCDIYIQINFKKNISCPEYVGVLEENNFKPEQTNEEYRLLATKFLEESIKNFQKREIEFLIDKALDEGNRAEFLRLSELYKKKLMA